jgi:hypothetical protein
MSGMLKACGENIRNYLEAASPKIFAMCSYYEGQFEHFDEEVLTPPACYIDYQSGEPSEIDDALGTIDFTLYIICSKLMRDPGNMLDTLEATIAALHKKPITWQNDETSGGTGRVGKLFYRGFRNNVTFPGLIVYEALFRVER